MYIFHDFLAILFTKGTPIWYFLKILRCFYLGTFNFRGDRYMKHPARVPFFSEKR